MSQRHNVFVSYHHANDQYYRNEFERLFAGFYDILIPKSVQIGELDPYLSAERIRQEIRDNYLRDSTVTVVLIGTETWGRKHVDWEIGSSIRQTQYNSRSGLLGILLPTHPDYYKSTYNECTIPPRLSNNINNGFAKIYKWSTNAYEVKTWIHEAFLRRTSIIPDNSFQNFVNNRSGYGWC